MISLKARILAVLLQFPRTDADKVWDADDDYREARLSVLAEAIDVASHGDRLMAGALITQAKRETDLDSGASSCNCVKYSCDHGKSRGYFQQRDIQIWPREWFDSFCWNMWQPAVTLQARLIARRINTSELECSFAHLKGIGVRCTEPWAVARAKMARELAGKL